MQVFPAKGGVREMINKPPLGCVPTRMILTEQINNLARAIFDYTNSRSPSAREFVRIESWANEIEQLSITIHNIEEGKHE